MHACIKMLLMASLCCYNNYEDGIIYWTCSTHVLGNDNFPAIMTNKGKE